MQALALAATISTISTLALTCCTPLDRRVDERYRRQATCDGLNDACIGGGRCCDAMSCGFHVACCVSAGEICDRDRDCCSGKCKAGVCSRSAALDACNSSAECKPGLECSPDLSSCYVAPGGYCRTSNDCGSNLCDGGTCVCGQGGALCVTGADCCEGFVCDGLCRGNGGATCSSDVDCNAGCCIYGACASCGTPIGGGCSSDSDCGPGASCDPATGTCL